MDKKTYVSFMLSLLFLYKNFFCDHLQIIFISFSKENLWYVVRLFSYRKIYWNSLMTCCVIIIQKEENTCRYIRCFFYWRNLGLWSLSDRKHIVAYAPLILCFFIERKFGEVPVWSLSDRKKKHTSQFCISLLKETLWYVV